MNRPGPDRKRRSYGRAAVRMIALMILIATAAGAAAQTVDTPEERFWSWFRRNAGRLYRYGSETPEVLQELQTEITKVHPLLQGILDGFNEDRKRVFIISAGGNPAGFQAARTLYRAALPMEFWKIVLFVPGRIRLGVCEYDGITVDSRDVRFLLFPDEVDGRVRVMFLFPGYRPDREAAYREIARKLLFDALGEYESAVKIGGVFLDSADSVYRNEAWPYQALPTRFNLWWYSIRSPG
jgi:hypothetical protein